MVTSTERRCRPVVVLVAASAALLAPACVCRYDLVAWWNDVRGDAYALDALPRCIDEGEEPGCVEGIPITTYAGETVRFEPAARVADSFATKLGRFEQLVARVARDHYGRPPRAVMNYGALACRAVRGRSSRLSEHALGNAIDVAGFSFPPLGRTTAPQDLPPALRRGFTVVVRKHWAVAEDGGPNHVHRAFLRELVVRMRDEGVFRAILGPGHPGHAGHLHLDYGPYRYTSIELGPS